MAAREHAHRLRPRQRRRQVSTSPTSSRSSYILHLTSYFSLLTSYFRFLDLADFLTFRATDDAVDVRSLCTVVCKWNYDARSDGSGVGWDRGYLSALGFPEGALPPGCIGDIIDAPGMQVPGGRLGLEMP